MPPNHVDKFPSDAARTLFCSLQLFCQPSPSYIGKSAINWPLETRLAPLEGTPLQRMCISTRESLNFNGNNVQVWRKLYTGSVANAANLQYEAEIVLTKRKKHHTVEVAVSKIASSFIISCKTTICPKKAGASASPCKRVCKTKKLRNSDCRSKKQTQSLLWNNKCESTLSL